jgi:hypothetical protein
VCVGDGVGVNVAGGPAQITMLISETGNPLPVVVVLLPPPQLSNSAAATKDTTGPNTTHLRIQTIEH